MNLHFSVAATVGKQSHRGFWVLRGPALGLCEKTTSRPLARGPAGLTWLLLCAWEPPPSGPEPTTRRGGAGHAAMLLVPLVG